jgi:hypothetical protein
MPTVEQNIDGVAMFRNALSDHRICVAEERGDRRRRRPVWLGSSYGPGQTIDFDRQILKLNIAAESET